MAFVITKKNFIEPFEVEIVAQSEEEQKELIAHFSIKHVNDWPEKTIEEFIFLQNRWVKMDSLLKSTKKKISPKQAEESYRINSAFNKLIEEYGLVEDDARSVWDSLSVPMNAEITQGYQKWASEKSKELKDKAK
jgi:hypothetical protein